METVLVYITAGDRAEALKVGRHLVAEKLVACANVLDGITSIYRWEGRVCEDPEAVLIAKTRQALVPAVTQAVRAVHSYDCPCVIALPMSGGHQPFLDWIGTETGAAG